MDQSVLSGHDRRPSDLNLFAELGLKALRYPVLWEKVSPDEPGRRDFSASDHRLNEIARLGMRPIVGLVHHGSGPRYTSLLDDEGFAPGLASHARAVAERYPWVRDWTPVNEPLTTARFSALYGIWYPHARNEGAFWRALINQIDATRLAMSEIRRVNPSARLIQTEDLGFAHATAGMAAQAAYENERRWITWDLLCGRVGPEHPLWTRISAWGLEHRLRAIADDPCPPDVIGVNHYLSSERLLDDRVHLYPPGLLGGDGPAPYVNIEAVRTVKEGPLGFAAILRQCWERYGLTMAVTECHNGCTREEQMRWFFQVWRLAEEARDAGVDLQAVTAWALLGSYDWNRLLAQQNGHYERGVYDVSSGRPAPTAMVGLLRDLAAGREPAHPAIAGRGWWERPERLLDQALEVGRPAATRSSTPPEEGRPILIVAPAGRHAAALEEACQLRDLGCRVLEYRACADPSLADRISGAARTEHAWAIIHVGGRDGPCRAVRTAAAEVGLPLAVWSEGARTGGPAAPRELWVLAPELISGHELSHFATQVVDALQSGRPFRAASNRYAPGGRLCDAAHIILDMLVDGATGEAVLEAAPATSWAELAAAVACAAELDAFLVEPAPAPGRGRRKDPPAPEVGASVHRRALPPLAVAAEQIVARHRLAVLGRGDCASSPRARQADALRLAAE